MGDVRGGDADPQRRIVGVLTGSQVLGGVGVATGVAVSSMTAASLSGSDTIGGLAQTSVVVGTALLAVPAARIAGRYGRRPALMFTYGFGTLGALIAAVGAGTRTWPLLLAGLLFFGGGSAAGLAARYAATDRSAPGRAARDLSVVVWATTIGSIAGPNLGGPADRLGLPADTGPFVLAAAAFGLAALVIFTGLRPDPLAGTGPVRTGPRPSGWSALRRSRPARTAVAAIVVSHTVMVSLMSMTPVHLHHGGATITVVGLVISLHIAGMYALSPLFGWLADRIGKVTVLLLGMAQFLAAALLAGTSSPHDVAQLSAGLFLLGTGWSAGVVAGSALLTESVATADRPAVQGLSDLLMNSGAAIGGIAAGALVTTASYATLAIVVATLTAPMAAFLLRARPTQPCAEPV